MATLKSHTKWIPGAFQVLHAEAGMVKPFAGSFTEAVNFETSFRKKNPALVAKNNWSLDPDDIANDVDAYNAQRMVAGGWLNFVDMEGQSPPAGGAARSSLGAVAAEVSGLAVYRELFQGKSVPVAHEEAERRAAICVVCPVNNTKLTFKQRFVAHVAKGLMELVGIMHDLDLKTSRDKELGTCDACECPMFAKVHVALPTIITHLKPDQRAKLHSSCWIAAPPLAGS